MANSVQVNDAFEALNILKPSVQSQPLETFTLFSALPAELRLKIWSYACASRVLPIRHHSATTHTLTFHHQGGRSSKTVTRFTTTAPPPALLSVCAESRVQALKIYSLTFATPSSPGTIYFSPIHDTLYFPRYKEMGYDETIRDFKRLVAPESVEEQERRRRWRNTAEKTEIWDEVRSIALDYVDVNFKRPWESYNKACLIRSFPKLEEISLVIPSHKSPIVSVPRQANSGEANHTGIALTTPRVSPEILLRWWAGFRHSFAAEERMLEEIALANGKPYEQYNLPVVNLVTKC